MADQRREDWRGPTLSMVLEATDPVKKDSGWEVVAVATALFKRQYPPRPPRWVVFAVNGEEIERVMTDNESGQASSTILIPAPGSYIITAFVADLPGIRASARKSVKEEVKKLPVPQGLVVNVSGPRGQQQIFIAPVGEGGKFIAGCAGYITDGDKNLPFTTGPDGVYQHEMNFTEPKRVFGVTVGGKPEQNWNSVLPGPKRP